VRRPSSSNCWLRSPLLGHNRRRHRRCPLSEVTLPPRHGGYKPKPGPAKTRSTTHMVVKPPSGKGGGSSKRKAA
jgi:hypothetical protein